jgi:hypothetical protein
MVRRRFRGYLVRPPRRAVQQVNRQAPIPDPQWPDETAGRGKPHRDAICRDVLRFEVTGGRHSALFHPLFLLTQPRDPEADRLTRLQETLRLHPIAHTGRGTG